MLTTRQERGVSKDASHAGQQLLFTHALQRGIYKQGLIPYGSACEAESPEHQLFWARPGVACLGSCRHSLWQRSDHVTVARLRVHVCSLTLPSPHGLGQKLLYTCGKGGKCCATSRAARTSAISCISIKAWWYCSINNMELHCSDDHGTSKDGVCDADGVLAAALPSPYLHCPRVSFNLIKLYQD